MPQSVWSEEERTRDRLTWRTVGVFPVPARKPFTEWADLACLVAVERCGMRGREPYAEQAYFVTSHSASAEEFAGIVRGHWQIENGLHWVKDVVLEEDACETCAGYAPENLALLRNVAVTLFRRAGYRSITRALRRFAHDVHALFRLLE